MAGKPDFIGRFVVVFIVVRGLLWSLSVVLTLTLTTVKPKIWQTG